MLTCRDAETGAKVWVHDFGVRCYASPTLVGESLYIPGTSGVVHILGAGREFRELSQASVGEEVTATPAFVAGRMYVRGTARLLCVGGR